MWYHGRVTSDGIALQFVPRLVVDDGDAAIEFYRSVFAVTESELHRYEDGRIANVELSTGHAQFALTSSIVDVTPSPLSLGGSPVIITIEHPDPDAVASAFVDAGGEILIPIEDRPYGRRDGRLRDPFGHLWIPGRPL